MSYMMINEFVEALPNKKEASLVNENYNNFHKFLLEKSDDISTIKDGGFYHFHKSFIKYYWNEFKKDQDKCKSWEGISGER